ncbi:twin-arginine translocase subunit TatC [bacterium]|nr:twin-arginine translocase subunit TatC [bacterium]
MSDLSLIDHLRELRRRIIICSFAVLIGWAISYWCFDVLIDWASRPFSAIGDGGNVLYVNSLFEGFALRMKFSAIGGVVLSFPVLLYQFVRFVFPGLKPKERKLIGWALASSIFLAGLSLFFGYQYFIPFAIRTMVGSEFVPHNVGLMLNYDQNVFYILNFLLWGLITFQLPLVLEILLYLDLVSRKALWQKSRYVVVAIFIIAAIASPPDVVSQCMIAIPLLILYFITILIAKIFGWGRDS